MRQLSRGSVEVVKWGSLYLVSELSLLRTAKPAIPFVLTLFTPSPDRFRAAHAAGGPEMVDAWRRALYANIHHPFLYTKALRMAAVRLGELTDVDPRTQRLLDVAPVAACAADLVENTNAIYGLNCPERVTHANTLIVYPLNVVKWGGTLWPLFSMTRRYWGLWAGMLRRR